MLTLALGPIAGVTAADKEVSRVEKTSTSDVNKLMDRLYEIKNIAQTTNLTQSQRDEYKKEVLGIKKQIRQQDPVLVISVTAALLVALILVLLARPRHHDY